MTTKDVKSMEVTLNLQNGEQIVARTDDKSVMNLVVDKLKFIKY